MSWDLVITILGYISGPVVGAIIGLFTNYLAVKMLFRPYYPKKIGNWTLPFTPGIIPKRKEAFAKAMGRAVGNELFTGDDIKALLCSDEVENQLASMANELLKEQSSRSMTDIVSSLTSEVTAESFKEKLSALLAEKIVSAATKMELGSIIAEKGKEAILEKKSSMGMLGMFLTDGIVDPLLEQVKEKVNAFLDEEATDVALPAIRDEVSIIADSPLNEQFDFSKIDEGKILSLVRSIYESAVTKTLACATSSIDICSVVEEKINQMDIKELEALCLRVMKKELGALVALGGILGFLIGIINIFV